MTDMYNSWANWATWNTWAHGDFESRGQVDYCREVIEEYESTIENGFLQSMTYFDEIDWDQIYEVVDRENTDGDSNDE
jgi:hypothetical protein